MSECSAAPTSEETGRGMRWGVFARLTCCREDPLGTCSHSTPNPPASSVELCTSTDSYYSSEEMLFKTMLVVWCVGGSEIGLTSPSSVCSLLSGSRCTYVLEFLQRSGERSCVDAHQTLITPIFGGLGRMVDSMYLSGLPLHHTHGFLEFYPQKGQLA